eukprot:GAHX01000850.1.p1 GENE.GAHX01000850.1~~GAHX01000850.1.p1  ORF type:complete len:765 (-),score=189.64 GAHX01000850.1:46-2340(-)
MFVIFYILSLFVTLSTQYTAKNVNELTDEIHEAVLNEPDRIKLVKFYMPTCGHCMSFKPTFEAVSNKLRKYVTSYTYNISVHGVLGSKLGIDSAPRTFVFKSLSDYKEINSRDQTQIVNMIHSFYNEKFKATSLKKFKENTDGKSFFCFYIGTNTPLYILDFLYREKNNKVSIYKLKKAPKYLKETNLNQQGLFSFNKGKLLRFNNEHTDKIKYLNNFMWRSERGLNNYILIKENSCRNKFISTLTGKRQNKNEIIYILVVNNSSKKNNKKLLKEFDQIINSFHNTENKNTKLIRYFVLDIYNNGNSNLLNKIKNNTYGQAPPLLITLNKETSKMKPLFLSKVTDIEQIRKYILDEFNAVEENKTSYKFSVSSLDLKSMRFMNNDGLCSDKSINKFRELSDEDLRKHSYSSAPLLVVKVNFDRYISTIFLGFHNLLDKLEELPNYIINIKNYTLSDEAASLVVTFKEETKHFEIDENNLNESSINDIVKRIKNFIVEKLKGTKDIPEYTSNKDKDNTNNKTNKKEALQKAISESGNKHKIIIINKKFNKKKMNKLKILKEVLKENFALFIADKTTLPELNFPINLKLIKSKKMEFILLLAPIDNDENKNNETEKIVKFDSFYYNDVFDLKKIISFINDRRLNFDLNLLVKDYKPLQFNMVSNKENIDSNCKNNPCFIKVLKENKDFGDIAVLNRNHEDIEVFVIRKEQLDLFKNEEWAGDKDIVLYFNGDFKSIKVDVSQDELQQEIKQMSNATKKEIIEDEEL